MAITRTKEMDLRSSDYEFLTGLTDGSTTIGAGIVTAIEEQIGFTLADVLISSPFTLITKASQVKAFKAAEAIAAGDKLFWDAGNNVVTKTSATGLIPCGYAIESALLGDTYALINFNGINQIAVPAE